ncbi:DUF397 domain-containing protein [Micromonospora sp. NEAU-HG-1]|nr:DUF397 domain-containing protein [Micromonospora rubida]NBE81216.1 DUF397 domain-containing protein [Micromonospora rubida]
MDVSRAVWKKSTRSGSSGSCVEVADNLPEIMVRDSKDQQGQVLHFAADQWAGFVGGIKDGRIGG